MDIHLEAASFSARDESGMFDASSGAFRKGQWRMSAVCFGIRREAFIREDQVAFFERRG